MIFDVKRILVVGAGGTGSILLPQLARLLLLAENMPELHIADGDSYSESNITRQNFALQYVGENKAKYQAELLVFQMPNIAEKIFYHDEYLSKADIDELVIDGTIVVNCVDNLAARKYVEDVVCKLDNGAHICCGNELRHGQVQISGRKAGVQFAPTIYERNPDWNSINDDRAEMTCEQIATLPSGGQVICSNMTAASIALNFVYQLMFARRSIPNCDQVNFTIIDNGYEKLGARVLAAV